MGCIGCKVMAAVAMAAFLANLAMGAAVGAAVGPAPATVPPFDKDDVLDVCFITDNVTAEYIKILGHIDVKSYFQVLSNIGNMAIGDLQNGLRLKHAATVTERKPVNLADYKKADTPPSQQLSVANRNYWVTRGTFNFLRKKGYPCDVWMLALKDDPVFSTSGNTGITNVYQICSDMSFGVFQLTDSNIRTSLEFMHQIGHLLGILHDEPKRSMGRVDTNHPNEAEKVRAECARPNNGCQAKPANDCIMNLNPTGIPPPPIQWSTCSQAYFELSSAMANAPNATINHDCFTTKPGSGNSAANPAATP